MTLFCFFALYYGATWQGRLFFVAVLLLTVNSYLCCWYGLPYRFCKKNRMVVWFATSALAVVALFYVPATQTMRRGGDRNLLVEHAYFDEQSARGGRGIGLVPEADHIGLGIGLARWVDPFVDSTNAPRIRRLCLGLYQEASQDPAFARMGSVMHYGYGEMLGRAPKGGHFVGIAPRQAKHDRPPLILFLHGSGGNFSVYWYALSPLAREDGYVVVCPSFGFGNWQRPDGVPTIAETIHHAMVRYAIHPKEIFLVALSNGGRGLTRVIKSHPGLFTGVVAISPVLERKPVEATLQSGAWHKMPVLLLHGAKDRRIPVRALSPALNTMKIKGARVTRKIDPEQDHYLMFSRRDWILEEIRRFVEKHRK